MPIDPSLGFSLADIAAQAQDMQVQRQQMGQRERALDQQDREFEMEMQRHTAGLAKEQREAASKGLEDVAAAVQWAQTPEQWAVVQQHYGQYSPEIARIPFEQREQALISVGKMADYLKNTAPKIQAIEPGGSLFSITPDGRNINELVRANPGNAAPLAPVGGDLPRPQSKADVDALAPGSEYIAPDGSRRRKGGGVSNGTGTFQP